MPAPQFATPRVAPQYHQQQQQPLVQQAPMGYKAPQPVEVYTLSDHANASITQEIREQFHRDAQGRVLFYTAPPINSSRIAPKEGQALGHSAKFLAAKAKRDVRIAAKRKADEANAAEREESAKKARVDTERQLKKDIEDLRVKALHAMEDQLAIATKRDFQMLMGNVDSADLLTKSLHRLAQVQDETAQKKREREQRLKEQESGKQIPITGMTVRLEDNI
jgi:chromatin structure-remodeling complex subunit RSC1/2